MNITLFLEKPTVGLPPFDFPKHSFRAFWTDDGRIGVVAVVERTDGGYHIMQDTINPPFTDEERHQIDKSNQHQERDE
jgi:hypothetical protein